MTTVTVWAHSEYAVQYDVGEQLPGSTFDWCSHWTKSGDAVCMKPSHHFVRAYMNLQRGLSDNEEHHCFVRATSEYDPLWRGKPPLVQQRLVWTAHVCETCEEEAMTA